VGHGRHGYHKEVMLIFGVNEDLCTLEFALGGFFDQYQGLPSLDGG
jgi:hypothetical protein